jgi:hypothetical protein
VGKSVCLLKRTVNAAKEGNTMKNILLALLGFILLSTPLAATCPPGLQFDHFVYLLEGQPPGPFEPDRRTITIICYDGPKHVVTIPATINGRPVTAIRDNAFQFQTNLTSVSIPRVRRIGIWAFYGCTALTSVAIGDAAYIGDDAFYSCTSLTGVYFQGNAPNVGESVFGGATNTTVYYLPGTTGWGTTFAGRPAVLWNPLVATGDASFGVRTNRFGLTITGTSNLVIVVEAATNLSNPAWIPVGTNTLTGGSSYFSDPQWTNHPARFYRLRSP